MNSLTSPDQPVERGPTVNRPDSTGMRGHQALTLGTIVAVAALLRLPFLASFPDVQNDEGLWTNSTKNFLLFGDWFLDERAHLFLSPVFHLLSLPAFWLFGPSIESARLVNALAGVGAVALLYLLAFRLTGDRRVATLGAILLAVDPWAVAHSRQALTESVLLFCVLLAGVLLVSDRRRLWLAGVAFALAILTKLSAGAMGIALGGYLLLRTRDEGGRSLTLTQRAVDGAVFGVVALGVAGLGYWLMSQIDPERFLAVFQRELGAEHLVDGAPGASPPGRVGLDPVLAGRSALEVLRFNPFLIVLGSVGAAVAWATRARGRLLLILWTVVGLGFPLTQVYQPLRYFFPAVPALVILVAILVSQFPKMSPPRSGTRILGATLIVVLGFNLAYVGMNVVANWGNRAKVVEHWARSHAAEDAIFLAATHFATNLPGRAYAYDIIAGTPNDLIQAVRDKDIDYVVWSHDEWSADLQDLLEARYTEVQRWDFGGVYQVRP